MRNTSVLSPFSISFIYKVLMILSSEIRRMYVKHWFAYRKGVRIVRCYQQAEKKKETETTAVI